MVWLNVDVIIVVTTPAAIAVKKATTTIPIVFPNAINPVESGLVASLAHPGGNLTGGAAQTAVLSTKRLAGNQCQDGQSARRSFQRDWLPWNLNGSRNK